MIPSMDVLASEKVVSSKLESFGYERPMSMNGNGNVVAARAEGNTNGNNGDQIRCYNCRGLGHLARNYTVRLKRRDATYLQTQLLIAQKEEAGIQLQAEEFDLMAAATDLDEIKKVNVNCILMANLQQASTSGTQSDKAPIYDSDGSAEVDKTNDLSNPVTSNSVPTTKESKVVENDKVISPGIFRINPFKTFWVDKLVPIKHVKASVRTKPITISQSHVITKNDVNSKTNGFSPKDVKSTTKTRRPRPRNNPKSDNVLFKSKSSCLSNKFEKIEENHKSLQSSNYPDHMSSECNNIKLAIRNEKSEVICATCKQCLITANHDKCVLQYVNGMNSRKKNQSANVSKSENKKKHKANVKESKSQRPKKVLLHLANLDLSLGGYQLPEPEGSTQEHSIS
nr:hypothetical protein [Tanacetum cinerariifolium]